MFTAATISEGGPVCLNKSGADPLLTVAALYVAPLREGQVREVDSSSGRIKSSSYNSKALRLCSRLTGMRGRMPEGSAR
jgi:hypothetical protein